MLNSLNIEQRFNQVDAHLKSVTSLRYRWFIIADYLSEIRENLTHFDTYIHQLVPKMPVIINPLSYTGADPARQVVIIDLLIRCEHAIPDLKKQPRFVKARDSLVETTCLLLAFTGEFKKLVLLFHQVYSGLDLSNVQWIIDVHKSGKIDNRNKLRALADSARAKGFRELANLCDKLFTVWNNQHNAQPHAALIPVVSDNNRYPGRLRRLKAQVIDEIESDHDKVVGTEKTDNELNETVAKAVRLGLNKINPELRDRYFRTKLSYEMKVGCQTGTSSATGLAAISYCAILDYMDRREKQTLNPNTVITGKLDERGNVVSVDKESIKTKASATFFSWAKVMVVPSGQLKLFKDEFTEFQDDYPEREPITLVGINHLDDMFFDRRITRRIREPKIKFYLKKVWKNKVALPLQFWLS